MHLAAGRTHGFFSIARKGKAPAGGASRQGGPAGGSRARAAAARTGGGPRPRPRPPKSPLSSRRGASQPAARALLSRVSTRTVRTTWSRPGQRRNRPPTRRGEKARLRNRIGLGWVGLRQRVFWWEDKLVYSCGWDDGNSCYVARFSHDQRKEVNVWTLATYVRSGEYAKQTGRTSISRQIRDTSESRHPALCLDSSSKD
jgi:hypothetical protein